jgi:hypothetical protein
MWHFVECFTEVEKHTIYWFISIQIGNKEYLVLEGKHSSRSEVTSGVPRRAVFRPILFLILINHITKNASSTTNLEYAATIWDPYSKLNL